MPEFSLKCSIEHIDISNFLSLQECSLSLRNLNVCIGANGAGKSNLVQLFRMLRALGSGATDNPFSTSALQSWITSQGGADSLLHYGNIKNSINIHSFFKFEDAPLEHKLELSYAPPGRLFFSEESIRDLSREPHDQWFSSAGQSESRLLTFKWKNPSEKIKNLLENIATFHFRDTSVLSEIRRDVYIDRNEKLYRNGSNLAAYLYRIQQKEPHIYRRILSIFTQIYPQFGEFVFLRELNASVARLNWRERNKEYLFGPHQLSDGTLSTLALLTALIYPAPQPPSVLIVDEPELGLHPFALEIIADLICDAASRSQVIVCTQSTFLLDQFEPQDIVVVERENGRTTFQRPSPEHLQRWLEQYSLSDLWEQNMLGGRSIR